MKLLGIGDNVCDVYLPGMNMYPGGQALNVAVNAKRCGAESSYLGVFGDDAVAAHVQNALKSEGVEFDRCRYYNGQNGCAFVKLEHGDRYFLGSNRGGVLQEHPIVLDQEDLDYCSSFDVIHTSNNSFLGEELRKLKELPGLISFDFSGSWKEVCRVSETGPYIDIAFLSGDGDKPKPAEIAALTLQQHGVGIVCVTRGSREITIYHNEQAYHFFPKYVKAVDTMGAGDSFAAAFLTALLCLLKKYGLSFRKDSLGELLSEAAGTAMDAAAKTCLISGAFGHGISVPEEIRTREMFREYMQKSYV